MLEKICHVASDSEVDCQTNYPIFIFLTAKALPFQYQPMMIRSRSFRGIAVQNARLCSRRFLHHTDAYQRRVEGKIAVITGAGSGIGRAAAAAFVGNGAKVVIADVNREAGKAAAAELGSDASFVECDVTKESEVARAVDLAVEMHSRLDIMYNNAGVACRTPPTIVDLDLSAFNRTLAINLTGMVAGMKHAARVMIPQREGCILCTGSVTGVMGGMAQHTYSVSKSAVLGLVRSAAAELAAHGIRVNCISPFAVPTPFTMDELRAAYPRLDDHAIREMLRATGELRGAHCEESDVANAALYLASDEAKYVSGHNLVVDGGFTAFKTLSLPLPDQI